MLMYASQLWSPSKLKDIRLIEVVQRSFTKCIYELRGLSYEERLRELHVLTLAKRRTYMDMILGYKCLHSLHECSLANVGLSLVESVTRGNDVCLVQRKGGALFSQKAPRTWNALPTRVVAATNISPFKHKLFNYLFDSQYCDIISRYFFSSVFICVISIMSWIICNASLMDFYPAFSC